MKKKIIIAVSVIGLLVVAAFITLKIMTKNAERNVATEKAINISASDLATQYKNFEDSANKMYLNKTIQLGGVVHSIESTENNQTTINIKISDSLPLLNCSFNELNKSINVNDTVTLKGICTGILSKINITNCIIIETKKLIEKIATLKIDSPTVKKNDTTTVQNIKTNTLPTIYNTTKAVITLDGGAGLEDIKATNNLVDATITTDGKIKFKLGLLAFTFSDALMQQHFNEEYVESNKFPTSTFVGAITNIADINFAKNGKYTAQVSGTLTLHGVTKPIKTTGTITISNPKISAQSSFNIKMEDYNISTDAAKSANLTINCNF